MHSSRPQPQPQALLCAWLSREHCRWNASAWVLVRAGHVGLDAWALAAAMAEVWVLLESEE